MTWILILLVHAGSLASTNSVTLTSVPGFVDKAQCEAAGKESDKLVKGTMKASAYVCVQGTRG